MEKRYQFSEVESRLNEKWRDSGIYFWDENDSAPESRFVIDTPPPTISGLLHIGHIFSYSQADFIARYKRMSGKNVFYPMGFDDNGLPTERLVEKEYKTRASQLPLPEFTALCDKTAVKYRQEFRDLFIRVGLSVDWNQEYNTVSPHCQKMSQMSFLDLYDKGNIYKKLTPAFWDPADQTAIAQAEVEEKEYASTMNYINFTSEDGKPLTVATTRPEMLPACVAMFFNPEEERYKQLEGKTALSPLFKTRVPIIADESVKIDKGTGLVMCCTFGDELDLHWYKEHNLPIKIIVNRHGKISNLDDIRDSFEIEDDKFSEVKLAIEDQKIKIAREKVIELLKSNNLMVKQEQITHMVKCAERSGFPLEIIPTNQWFISVLKHKDMLQKRAAECNWHPNNMHIKISQWIDGLKWDWCISRQRYFGVPFPIWYSKREGEEGKVLLAPVEKLPVNPKHDLPDGYTKDEVTPETDIMDTWGTSAISPQLNSHGITETFAIDGQRHNKLFPADLRPQAHEIIRTWAFYTIVKAQLHQNTLPWKNIMISGWCLAEDKTKMSKSKGNVVSPIKILDEYGTDVVRYWASTSRLGSDTAYSSDVMHVGKKLVTKLWNAGKFVLIQTESLNKKDSHDTTKIKHDIDLWATTKLNNTIARATEMFENYEYCNAREVIEDFFWNVFCDNYLEIVKKRGYTGCESALNSLSYIFHQILKLLGPFLPYITEELASIFAYEDVSIHSRGSWPIVLEPVTNHEAENMGDICVDILNVVRKVKADHELSIKSDIGKIIIPESVSISNEVLEDLRDVSNVKEIARGTTHSGPEQYLTPNKNLEIQVTI